MSEGQRYIVACIPEATCRPASTVKYCVRHDRLLTANVIGLRSKQRTRKALQLATHVAPVVRGFNYTVYEAHNAPAYKFNNSARHISAIDEHSSEFWPNSNCACAETAISELPVNILTRRWIRRSRFPVRYRYFGNRWTFTM